MQHFLCDGGTSLHIFQVKLEAPIWGLLLGWFANDYPKCNRDNPMYGNREDKWWQRQHRKTSFRVSCYQGRLSVGSFYLVLPSMLTARAWLWCTPASAVEHATTMFVISVSKFWSLAWQSHSGGERRGRGIGVHAYNLRKRENLWISHYQRDSVWWEHLASRQMFELILCFESRLGCLICHQHHVNEFGEVVHKNLVVHVTFCDTRILADMTCDMQQVVNML